jgi:hypothetical protein
MSEREYKSRANLALDEHPELRRVMNESARFADLKERFSLDEVEGERVYLVNDTQGDEDDLFIDALAKGARESSAGGEDDAQGSLYRELFLELDDELKAVAHEVIGRRED